MHGNLIRFEFFKMLARQQITYFYIVSGTNGISLKLAQRATVREKATIQWFIQNNCFPMSRVHLVLVNEQLLNVHQ